MNIYVRVQGRAAQAQIAALETQIKQLQRTSTSGASAMGGLTGALKPNALESFGSRLQWIGRQLQYNFTLPIALAGIAATKFELDNQKAMTGVTKVYGDGSATFNQLTKTEIPALGKAFEVLSNEFAVNRAQVIGIGADWAQAGASGLALAKSVKLTLETMILGEMNATEATQALISIQAQYGQTIDQLSSTIDVLNMVENQTGITMEGLVQGFARAAGVARSAGVDVRHLAAFLAALTPAAGSAANAGNALKTIFSRLMAPTTAAAQVMKLMGINTEALSWQSENGTQRLELMAKSFANLSGAQKLVVSSTIASRFQINRFDVLMRDILNTNGYYQRALKSTADATANYRQKQYELNTVLTSNPQRLKQIWTILQNALADTIQPLLPAIIYLSSEIAKLVTWFSNLNPAVQHLALVFLVLLAAIGPVVRYLGAVVTMFGALKTIAEVAGIALGESAKGLLKVVSVPFELLTTGLGAVAGVLGKGAVMFGLFAKTALSSALTVVTGGFGLLRTSLSAFGTFWVGSFNAIRGFTVFWATQMRLLFSLVGLGVYSIPKAIALAFTATGGLLRNLLMVFSGLGRSLMAGLVGGLAAGRALFEKAFLQIFYGIARLGPILLDVLTGPIGIAIGAAVILFVIFRKQIEQIWNGVINIFKGSAFTPVVNMFKAVVDFIERQFDRLPQSVQAAFEAVVKVVAFAAQEVYKLFSYLNPFAHHSPSLVENTQKGMKQVQAHHAAAAQSASSLYQQTSGDINTFNKATGFLNTPQRQYADQRADVKKVDPAALASFDRLIADLTKLNALLAKQKAAVDAQQAVVDKWKSALDKANAALDAQQNKLQSLQKAADALNNSLQAHQDALQNFANTPIQGMKAMNDAIFANDQAQKALQLQMLKMEDVTGPLDKVQSKMADIAGQIEQLKGEQTSLRQGGAGSEITGAYDQQISALQSQQQTINAQLAPIQALQDQLDKLQQQGQELNLEQSLQFDPLTKQIQDMTDSMKELPFDQIVAGIQQEQQAIAQLTPQADAANAAVAKQQTVVDQATAARDKIQDSYDKENAKLQVLQDNYQKTQDAISGVTDALNTMGSAASKAASAAKGAGLGQSAKDFQSAAGGNFPDVGGMAKIGREGGLTDQSAAIDQWAQQESKNLGKIFGSFDMFGPIRKKWKDFTKWWSENVAPALKPIEAAFKSIGSEIGAAFSGSGSVGSTVSKTVSSIMGPFSGLISWITRQVKLLIQLFGPDIKRAFNSFVGGFEYAWKKLSPEVKPLLDLFVQIWKAVQVMWTIVKPILELFALFFIARIKMIVSILSALIGPAFHLLVDTIKNALDVVMGIIRVFTAIFTGNWSEAWEGIKEIVSGIFKEIWDIISNAGKALLDVVKAIVDGIIDFFKFLYDELVGHSIIPDMLKAIVDAFTALPGMILGALATLGKLLLQLATDALKAFWNGCVTVWKVIVAWFTGRPGDAYAAVVSLIKKLEGLGHDAFNALFNAAKAIWKSVNSWLHGIPGDAASAIGSLGSKLVGVGRAGFDVFWSAIKSSWSNIYHWATGIPGQLVSVFDNIGSKIAKKVSGMWDPIKNVFRDAINGIIRLWDSLHLSIGGWVIKVPLAPDIHIPKVTVSMPYISPLATGGVTAGPALVGEGKKGFPEYVIPTDPAFRRNAMALYTELGRTLGLEKGLLAWITGDAQKSLPAMAMGGVIGTAYARATRQQSPVGPITVNKNTTVHFHGDLEFPNVKSGDDAEEFLRNLEAVT